MTDTSIPRPLERPEIVQRIEEDIRIEKRANRPYFLQTFLLDDPLTLGLEAYIFDVRGLWPAYQKAPFRHTQGPIYGPGANP
jgi:hypothetical protein